MLNENYYHDKIAIVTGANSGIGFAIAKELLKRGAIVYMSGRNTEKLNQAIAKLPNYKDQIRTIIMDVTNKIAVHENIEKVAKLEGRIDFLFNNAGIGGHKPFELISYENWEDIVNANIWSVIYGTKAAVPIMLKQGYGHIINTSSYSGLVPYQYKAHYDLTKFAIVGFTESLRYEYIDKINFSTICPSKVSSELFKKTPDGKTHDELKIPSDAMNTNKAAKQILDEVEKNKRIIIVSAKKNLDKIWLDYIKGKEEVDEKIFAEGEKLKKLIEVMLKLE